ncbi:PepSY-associated TM helix domain-containing protein [Cyclobacterium qasimii]|uniref:Sulfite reductase n=2 Tax=Cyclobacterium qasimii TaxID=1350429 RepID=A0A512C5L4_9BACT|nr:PepSY domain-containing protein [Cyclobacterium qasimii]EPR67676.1 putative iron-regulated membrane protein [Cyclobacterium qasimii M12-11B]GEO19504.1 sulfite reductase [Cyclobacterium qasimii]
MKKTINQNIFPWIWKWHFIGGIISAPVIIILAITGILYLFRDSYEASQIQRLSQVEEMAGDKMTYQQQWELVKKEWEKVPTAVALPGSESEGTEFISGKFSQKSSLYIDPYAKKVNGIVNVKETDMQKVRKLHGELLLGRYGAKVVELVASWMVVLIITGLYIFWPRGKGIKGFVTIRTNQTKRILYRDIHALIGFWFSILLIIVLAGGLPWTDVFGAGFRWVQDKTETGYPATWESNTVKSIPDEGTISLDEVMAKAKELSLDGRTLIDLPQKPTDVFSIYNRTANLSLMKKYHLDQYSGEVLVSHGWADIGILIKGRLWVMAFHQGQFGLWNWYLMIFVAAGLLVLSVAAIVAYFYRKRPGSLSVPAVPDGFSPSIALLVIVMLLGVTLPLFGLSVVLIFILNKLKVEKKMSMNN